MKRKKYIFWGLAVCLIIQVVIVGFAAAAGPIPDDLTAHTEYLVVHDTAWPAGSGGGPSVITVKAPDKNPILPSGSVYSNIPNGSTIELSYGFHLLDGAGTDFYTYSGSNYFTIDLPEDITFKTPTGDENKIYAQDETNPSDLWLLGTWSFTDSNSILVDFTEDVSHHKAMWGKIRINGTFNNIKYGDEDERTLILGSESVIFRRTPPTPPSDYTAKERRLRCRNQ